MSAAKKISQDEIVQRLDELPTLPAIVYELSQTINDPMSSTKEVEDLMGKDQSITAKVLRLANSAYYAIPGGVTSLGRAIAFIGFDTINQLVLSTSILKALEVKGPSQFDLNEFWKHSVGVAIAAETIAKVCDHPLPSDLFTCGLVHDMGKVALYTLEPELIVEAANLAKEKSFTFRDAEIEMGLPGHHTVGSLLAQKWNLPIQIQMVIKHHHEPKIESRSTLSQDLNLAVDITVLANLLVHALKFGQSGHEKILGIQPDLMERLKLTGNDALKQLTLKIKKNLESATEFLKVLGGE